MTGKERGMSYIAADILKPLDLTSLANAELVSDEWRQIILEEKLWKHLFNRNASTVGYVANPFLLNVSVIGRLKLIPSGERSHVT